jgi:hypothetical protein
MSIWTALLLAAVGVILIHSFAGRMVRRGLVRVRGLCLRHQRCLRLLRPGKCRRLHPRLFPFQRRHHRTGAPVEIPAPVLRFYLPAAVVTVLVISFFMWRRAGGILLVLYAALVVGGYLVSEAGAVGMFS